MYRISPDHPGATVSRTVHSRISHSVLKIDPQISFVIDNNNNKHVILRVCGWIPSSACYAVEGGEFWDIVKMLYHNKEANEREHSLEDARVNI